MTYRGSGLAALSLPRAALEGPKPLSLVEPLELQNMYEIGAKFVIVDVRSVEERADGFLTGSIHAPFEEWFTLEPGEAAFSGGTLVSDLLLQWRSSPEPLHLIFHCMYSKERGPRAAEKAILMLGESAKISLLEGGFQQCMTQLWPQADKLLESVCPEQWISNGKQGLVWKQDIIADRRL